MALLRIPRILSATLTVLLTFVSLASAINALVRYISSSKPLYPPRTILTSPILGYLLTA